MEIIPGTELVLSIGQSLQVEEVINYSNLNDAKTFLTVTPKGSIHQVIVNKKHIVIADIIRTPSKPKRIIRPE